MTRIIAEEPHITGIMVSYIKNIHTGERKDI